MREEMRNEKNEIRSEYEKRKETKRSGKIRKEEESNRKNKKRKPYRK